MGCQSVDRNTFLSERVSFAGAGPDHNAGSHEDFRTCHTAAGYERRHGLAANLADAKWDARLVSTAG